MFTNVPVRHEGMLAGQNVVLETGLLATQADSAVLASIGETTVLAAVVIGKPMDTDFFPLQIVYEERLYASGKIKGSRFMKREGRPSDNAVLTGRLIDRSIRSLLDDHIRNDTQIVITVLSLDEVNQPDLVAVLAASSALKLAGVREFRGPVSSIRIGQNSANNLLITNPSYEVLTQSNLDIVVSGSMAGICMVEAGAKIVKEEIIANALELAVDSITMLNGLQNEFIMKAAAHDLVKTKEMTLVGIDQNANNFWKAFYDEFNSAYFIGGTKETRMEHVDTLKSQIKNIVKLASDQEVKTPNEITPGLIENPNQPLDVTELKALSTLLSLVDTGDQIKSILKGLDSGFSKLAKEIIQTNILHGEKRVDGRRLDQLRPITCQVNMLPRVHGSSLFSRGETQVLNVLTLGTTRDAQTMDDMEDFVETTKRYIHHYNFPSYSVGETGRYTGPGRREIGHGALAERALLPVLPDESRFPYTMRLVSETMGSNGSTSMASTCSSSLSLMAAGVPISNHVAGIAMGLVIDNETGVFKILTDIQDVEDYYCGMDFKVTGTKDGITAIQLDNKMQGITPDILRTALAGSLKARLEIIDIMNSAISTPSKSLSPTAPRVAVITIPQDKIGEVIGPSGKIIKSIIARTGCEIDIEDETGRCFIYGKSVDNVRSALDTVKALIKEYERGEKVKGKVYRIEAYGAFIKIEGTDKEGMIHISRMSNKRVEKVEDILQMGDEVEATITEINDRGQIGLSLI